MTGVMECRTRQYSALVPVQCRGSLVQFSFSISTNPDTESPVFLRGPCLCHSVGWCHEKLAFVRIVRGLGH